LIVKNKTELCAWIGGRAGACEGCEKPARRRRRVNSCSRKCVCVRKSLGWVRRKI